MKKHLSKTNKDSSCPCGAPTYEKCCGRFISNAEAPSSATLLMRSRYSAYVLEDENYLQATWHSSTRPALEIIDAESNTKWLGLEILNSKEHENEAIVEFVARYKIAGRAHRLHEVSRFVREFQDGVLRWFYLDGSFPEKKQK